MIKINIFQQKKSGLANQFLKTVVNKTLRILKVKEAKINLIFIDKKEITKFNKNYRRQNKPTDVLSFCYFNNPLEGEIIIYLAQIRKQAKEYKHSFTRELIIIIIHSLLHLLGYDHQNNYDVRLMQAKEDEIQKIIFNL